MMGRWLLMGAIATCGGSEALAATKTAAIAVSAIVTETCRMVPPPPQPGRLTTPRIVCDRGSAAAAGVMVEIVQLPEQR